MFSKVLIPGEGVTLPVQGKNDRLQIVVDIEPGKTAVERVGLGLNLEGYGVPEYCVFAKTPSSAESALEWLQPAARDKETARTLAINLAALPEEIGEVWVMMGVEGEGAINDWGAGGIRIKSGIHSWEWMFHGSRLGDGVSIQAVVITRLKLGQWFATIQNHLTNSALTEVIAELTAQPEFYDIDAATVPITPIEPLRFDVADIETKAEGQAVPAYLTESYDLAKAQLAAMDLVGVPTRYVLVLEHTRAMKAQYESQRIHGLLQLLMGLALHGQAEAGIEIFLAEQSRVIPLEKLACSDELPAPTWLEQYPLTSERIHYGRVIETVRRAIYPANQGGKVTQLCRDEPPVFVLWAVTQDAEDAGLAQWQMRWASREPLFWHFMAISGQSSPLKSASILLRQFSFIESLAKLSELQVQNADCSTVNKLGDYAAHDLYRVMLEGYAKWVKEAQQQGMLKKS